MSAASIKAIREYCLECLGNSSDEVRKCTAEDCKLYVYRFGTDPFRKARKPSAKALRKLAEGRSLTSEESHHDVSGGGGDT